MSLLDAAGLSETSPDEDEDHGTDEGQMSAAVPAREGPSAEGSKIWDMESRINTPPNKMNRRSHWHYRFMDPETPIPNTLEPPRDYKTELVSAGVSLDWKTVHGYLKIPFHVNCLK